MTAASPVFAGNPQGNGKGIASAPGQADNFDKGVTTTVTVTKDITTGVEVVVDPKVYGTPVVTSVLSDPVVSISEFHDYSIETKIVDVWDGTWVDVPNPNYNGHNSETIKVKHMVSETQWRVWDNLTTTTTTTRTETVTTTTAWSQDTKTTPWTQTVTTTTTVQRHGSPQGNGAVISTDVAVSTVKVSGETVVTTENGLDIENTTSELVNTTSSTEKVAVQADGNQGWITGVAPTTWP